MGHVGIGIAEGKDGFAEEWMGQEEHDCGVGGLMEWFMKSTRRCVGSESTGKD